MILILLTLVFGALGAASRFAVNEWTTEKLKSTFPSGTFLINISGSFAAGIFGGLLQIHPETELLVLPFIVGYLGAYTTFSTWMVQAVGLFEAREWSFLILHTIASMILGALAAWTGFWVVV